MITLIELARLGWVMRQKQKEYFRHKGNFALAQAKAAEAKFDAAIDEMAADAKARRAPTLFAGQEGSVPK